MNTFKMTKKGNVEELDVGGNVVAKYVAVPYTTCQDCAFSRDGCVTVICTPRRSEDEGYGYREVHFVLKAKKPKKDLATVIKDILVSAGLSVDDATKAGISTVELSTRPLEWVKDKKPSELLWGGFIWEATKEGHFYWGELVRKLEESETPK